MLPNKVRVAFVFRVYGDSRIAQHGFGSCCGDDQVILAVQGFRPICQWVAEVPQVALFFVVLYFEVGNRGAEDRVPVDQPLATINQAFVEQSYKYLLYGGGVAFVHREALSRPVNTGSHAADLF